MAIARRLRMWPQAYGIADAACMVLGTKQGSGR